MKTAVFFILGLFLAGGTTQVYAEAISDVPPSVVTLPIEISAKALTEVLEAELPTSIDIAREKHSRRIAGVRVSVHSNGKVTRGAIRIEPNNGGLIANSDLDIWVRVWRGSVRQTIRGKAALTARLGIDVTGEWQLDPDVAIRYRWIDRPTVKVLGIKISLGRQTDRQLRRVIPNLEERLVDELREAIDLKAVMTEFWKKLHEPVQLSDTPPLWLVPEPISIALPSPTTANGLYRLAPRIESRLRVVTDPASAAKASDLPALNKRPREGSSSLSISVPVELPYGLLAESLMEEVLEDRAIEFRIPAIGDGSFVVEDLLVEPAEDGRIAVGLRILTASENPLIDAIEGWIWIVGTPEYSAANQKVVVSDWTVNSDLDIDSRMRVFYNGALAAWLRSKLPEFHDFSPYISQLHELAAPYLNASLGDVLGDRGHHLLDSRLVSRGHIESVKIGRLVAAAEHLIIPVLLEADFRLFLEPEA